MCQKYVHIAIPVVCLVVLFTGMFGTLIEASGSTATGWSYVSVPAAGDDGGWVLAPGSDIVEITAGIDGRLYAAVSGLTRSLFTSDDGGHTWYQTGNAKEVIVDIALSPHDDETVVYATANRVYQSSDRGMTFSVLPRGPVAAGSGNRTITSIDITWLDGIIIAVGVRDEDSGEYGGVYVFDERDTVAAWQDTGAGAFDALAVAFSPNYHIDRHLIAAVTDETDSYLFSRRQQNAWNASTPAARLNRDNASPPAAVAATAARIAFPHGFLAGPEPQDAHIFAAISTGSGDGDVYTVSFENTGTPPVVTDCNIGREYGWDNLDVACLAIERTGKGRIMAGAAGSNDIFFSADGGSTWSRSAKPPAGTAVTSLCNPGGTGNDTYYAATSGNESGLASLTDEGIWNQVSLIDTRLDTIIDFAPSPAYDADGTLFLLSCGGSHSLWRSRDYGSSWERILWEEIAGITTLDLVALPPEYGTGSNTVYCAGESDGVPVILQSADGGDTYRLRFTRDPQTGNPFTIDAWAVAGPDTLVVAGYDGAQALVYKSGNGGFFFSPGITAGNQPLASLVLSPDYAEDGGMLVSNSLSLVYLYDDTGRFRPLPEDSSLSPFNGTVATAFDPGYTENHIVYAAGDSKDDGIYRIHAGADTTWERIGITLSNVARIQSIVVADKGVFYALNMATDGGMERCLYPASRSPEFDTLTQGLVSGTELCGAWINGNHIWSTDDGTRLVRFDDILTEPVSPENPANGAGGLGSMVDHTVRDVTLDWETFPGVIEYEWQCDDDTGFNSLSGDMTGTTEASSTRLPPLEPGVTYYWRIRASEPVFSPWSDAWHFTTCLDTEAVILTPESPASGATGVPVIPVFQWTAIGNAESYELVVAHDARFALPVLSKTGNMSLPENAWLCDSMLETGTTYYWKVRACTPDSYSAWSGTGIFTTIGPGSDSPSGTGQQLTRTPEGTVAGVSEPSSMTPTSMAPAQIGPMTIIVTSVPSESSIPSWTLPLFGGILGLITLLVLVMMVLVVKIRLH